MGVTIRDKRRDGVWWVFVNHFNRRTSLKVGSKRAAQDVQQELQVWLAIDRVARNLRPRSYIPPPLANDAEDLRLRLRRLLDELEALLERNKRNQ